MNITLMLIAVTAITSILAFSQPQLIEHLLFYPYRMWRTKEWHRLVSCSFIHADWGHLLFNMFALYSFGSYVEESFNYLFEGYGRTLYVVMYFGAVALADSYNLFTQKNNPSYRSLGASGGVSAIIFSFILLNPFGKIYIFFIPIGIPAFVFGPLYLLYSVYMAKQGTDNVGHIAHFTGSIVGFVLPILFYPNLLPRFVQLISNGYAS